MREDELEKNLQPFLAYLAQTPVNELLNDYTYQLVFIGHDAYEQEMRYQRLCDVVTAPGTGIKWTQVDTWRAGCAKCAADDPAGFYESGDRWHDRHFGKKPAPVRMENVQPEETQWLVPGLIPLGEISVLGADGGTGKGIWQAQLIAYVTSGKTSGFFPVPAPQTGKVLVLSGEDDPGRVLEPRYQAAGADLSKIFVMTSDDYYEKTGRLLSIKDKALDDFVDTCEPILIIIDPLQSFLPSDLEMGSRNQMRGITVPLKSISNRRNCSSLISMHTNKKQGVFCNCCSTTKRKPLTLLAQRGRQMGGKVSRQYRPHYIKNGGFYNAWLHCVSIFYRGPVRAGLFLWCRCDVVQRHPVRGWAI